MTRPVLARRLWFVAGSLVGVLLLVFAASGLASAFARERSELRTVVDDPVAALRVDAPAASRVHVVGTSAERAVVQAETSRGLVAPDVTVEVVGDRLEVGATCDDVGPPVAGVFCWVELTIEVPAALDVEVRGVEGAIEVARIDGTVDLAGDGGTITVADTAGPVAVDVSGGSFEGTGLAGAELVAVARGGGVHATFDRPPRQVEVRTEGGGATVVLPPGEEAYRVAADAHFSGTEIVDVPDDPGADRSITVVARGGGVTIRRQGAT